MKTMTKFERLSASIAAVAVSLLMVWAISDYALPADGISATAGMGGLRLAFVAN